MKGISPNLCTHLIPMEPDHRPSREHQRRLNDEMREVVKKEVLKLLHAGIIYPVQDSEWVSLVQVVQKKGGMTVVQNERNELIPQRTVTGWRMCIDYRMLNKATRKDHFPHPFIDEMLERLSIRMTRIRLPSPARMARSPIGGCPLVSATHPLLFSGV